MKRFLCTLAAFLLLIGSVPACSRETASEEVPSESPEEVPSESIETSTVWTLPARYSSKYTTLTYFVTYEVDGEQFCLRINRSKAETGSSKRVRESKEVDGTVYALCESKELDESGNASYTYYECFTGQFHYFIGRESGGFFAEAHLSMDEAIALMKSPVSPGEKVKLSEEEWNAMFQTDTCNLEVLIRPNDNGALIKSLPASYSAKEEAGETVYVSGAGDEIAYTNGTDSIQIRQANRAGTEQINYHTLSECKAILALLGSK